MDSPDLAPDAPWDLLARQLAGEATPAEQAELRAWANHRPENQAVLTEATQAWTKVGAPVAAPVMFSPADVDKAWQRFETQAWGGPSGTANPPTPGSPPPPPVAPPTVPPAGWLAGVWKTAGLLAVGAGAGWVLNSATHDQPTSHGAEGAATNATTTSAPVDSVSSRTATAVPLPGTSTDSSVADGGAATKEGRTTNQVAADLVFDNTPLPVVAAKLETALGVRLVLVEPALKRCRFTGTFRHPQAEQVLHVISVATSTTLTPLPDGSWELRGNGCE